MRNRYRLLHLKIFFSILKKRKISFKKLWNAVCCQCAYWLQSKKSARAPLMVSMELGNHCNINCLFCRNEKGVIPDVNPVQSQGTIPKGWMPPETAMDIIDQLKDYLLIAVLYTNGEPLMYKKLSEVVHFATRHKVASMIATNGTLLNEKNIKELLESGLDFVKIALSGYTQDIYEVQVRNGDVEKVKKGIEMFVRMNREGRYGTVIMVDYILYEYNRHQLKDIQEFCEKLDVMLSVRPGNPKGGLEGKEASLSNEILPLKESCDWLWKALQIDWNGDVLHCCECAVWGNTKRYAKMQAGQTDLLDVWNGVNAMTMRQTITHKGRGAVPVCSGCLRRGISFKW